MNIKLMLVVVSTLMSAPAGAEVLRYTGARRIPVQHSDIMCMVSPAADCLARATSYYGSSAHLEAVDAAVSHSRNPGVFSASLLVAARAAESRAFAASASFEIPLNEAGEARRTRAAIAAYGEFLNMKEFLRAGADLNDPARDAAMEALRVVAEGGGTPESFAVARTLYDAARPAARP
ncbi:MAG: hypothetical protein SF051_00115 [Elusimicrobiota bacterium]|nr:hypothetical protein [Elusimicrobiota bacterium]